MSLQHPTRERVTTIGEGGRRFWLYPANFHGFWLKRRQIAASLLIVFFLVLPWIKIGGHQAVLLDIAERKFAFFGLVFWPQDLYIFWFFVVGGLISIFLITAQWGRLWCGWACPQTVFLEHVFRKIEKLIEGDATQRRRLDRGPLTLKKFGKKALKYIIFIAISVHFANTVLCYFAGSDDVIAMTFSSPRVNWGWFTFMGFLSFMFFVDFAWFREQFCIIACPYGRFQSALLDEHSLIVGYDYNRGEPREKLRKGKERHAGDCIDCHRCVAVCPTGIDIRMGLQMECINCTACIDACDEIMEKVDKPKGLIRYTSIIDLKGGSRRAIRARTLMYTGLVTLLFTVGTIAMITKRDYGIQVLRATGAQFSRVQGDTIINQFKVKISNKTSEPLTLTASAPKDYQLVTPLPAWTVPAQSNSDQIFFIRKSMDSFSKNGKERMTVSFISNDRVIDQEPITILGPKQ